MISHITNRKKGRRGRNQEQSKGLKTKAKEKETRKRNGKERKERNSRTHELQFSKALQPFEDHITILLAASSWMDQ